MAWNDNTDKDNNQPPELDEVIAKFREKFTNFGSKNNGNATIPKSGFIKVIIAIIVIIWLASGFYIIDTGERGVILQFGKFQKETGAGPHWHIPYPIESKITVKVDEIRSEKIGFRNITNNNRRFVGNVSSESLMLTKDENIIDAKFEVQYKIKNAHNYLFNVAAPNDTLKQISESVIRLVVGRNAMDYIITEGRSDVVAQIEENAQILLDEYKTGLQITSVNMLDAQAPEPVQAAFSDVVKSREDKTRLVNEAETYANGILPQAGGEAARVLEESRAYKARVTAKAEGDVSRFNQIREQYEKAPLVTKERLYLETMESVLANTSKIVVDSNSSNVMYLPLDKLGRNRADALGDGGASANKNINNNKTGGSIRNAFRTREVR